ncbi:hypothetical protein M2152_000778 [Microbacteriaceae bacterium SG_E_30_P1]|uniref:NADH:ubiquinone oxidoreductase subunit 4 (Chain M) n=1 Tax=Antiquaquibacter oligotrophicus TaxID=2880260 RepID=A0ABT6KLH6_9MICO|nr:NADH:ubiquinone oxidoreductase subunit 4 (chain M) [Antiquaquibacter oligotrophicus]MDH6180596.1 hypothetical protein [Antiquaquibacter oligotrophicus]UDF13672.1 NADH:ubiquinone oxidoreductase subunit 4 (chain M) [Antiquaquibacter oligotrophicus]
MGRSIRLIALVCAVALISGCASDLRSAPIEADDDFGTVEVFAVDGDGMLEPDASGLAEHVWSTFTRVATPEFAGRTVSEYRVGDAPDSDTMAYVFQADDPTLWVLAANLSTSDDDTLLIPTLIHEYAHIITLSPSEVDPDTVSCPTLDLDEGCANLDSVLLTFYDHFWAGYGDDAPAPGNSDSDAAYEFYREHENDFVSDYAATNVVEDLAESFMTFVLEPRPTGDTVIARKLEFFWSYPDFVTTRERILAEFTAEIGPVD